MRFLYQITLYAQCKSDINAVPTYNTMHSVPAVISSEPIIDFAVICSWRKITAKINVITTLNLSIGTTLDASPCCNAL